MKLKDKIILTIKTNNGKSAVKISNFLQFNCGMNYKNIYDFVNKQHPISLPEWDQLLRDGEDEEQ